VTSSAASSNSLQLLHHWCMAYICLSCPVELHCFAPVVH
jgi:hypothetical protein